MAIDRDKLDLALCKLGWYARFASILAASDAGATTMLVEETWANKTDAEIIEELKRAARDTGYLARRLAGLAGAYSPKRRRRRRPLKSGG